MANGTQMTAATVYRNVPIVYNFILTVIILLLTQIYLTISVLEFMFNAIFLL